MDPITEQLNERFALPSGDLGPAIIGELQSILRIHSIDPEELSYKWESYCMKMGAEETTLDLKTVRDFKKDLQEALERESRGKVQSKGNERRAVGATPRAGMNNGDVFGALDGLLPNTPHSGVRRGINGSTTKRKTDFETPSAKSNRSNLMSSPSNLRTPEDLGTPLANFSDRKDGGAIQESLNPHIEIPESTESMPSEARLKLKANTEISKFAYKTMAMKLSEASEILDDRIDEVAIVIQQHYKLEDSAFGNPASQSQNEIIVVGRIASDTSEGNLNTASLVLETSRRTGAGLRVPLRVENLQSYQFFPGKIVALKGINASGEFFSVTEILEIPQLFPVATSIDAVDVINDRITLQDGTTRPLVTIVASGPYTTEDTLDFSPLQALLRAVLDIKADGLVLCGPFIDAEHPLIRTGDFDLPENYPVSPDKATLSDLFKAHISSPLSKLCQALPTISIVLCPSVRDAISKHAAWPQDRLVRKELSVPRQVSVIPNPMLLSFNEIMFGMSSQDVLSQLQATEVVGGQARYTHVMDRLCRQLIEQRHFFPVLPPVERQRVADTAEGVTYSPLGAMLDISYLKLGEWLGVKPDVLITPSILPPFGKVIEGVVSINPGTLSKKRGPGTYARLTIQPLTITDEDRDKGELVGHRVFDRCRVDIVKI